MPGTDLTARIMAQVAVTPITRPVAEKPLIGRKGWAMIVAGTITLFALAFIGDGSAIVRTPSYFAPFTSLLNGIRLPQGDWPAWAIGASACALLFTALDRVLARKTAQ